MQLYTKAIYTKYKFHEITTIAHYAMTENKTTIGIWYAT